MPTRLMPTTLKSVLVASAIVAFGTTSVFAAEPKWVEGPYDFVVVDQNVRDTLLEFGRNNNISVRVTDAVRGRVRGSVTGLSPREFLDRVTKDNGLVWYYDGALLHISSNAEVSTEIITPLPAVPEKAIEKLQAGNILDDRFAVRPAADGVSLAVTGPPAYRAAVVQAVTTATALLQKPRAVRVFRGGKADS